MKTVFLRKILIPAALLLIMTDVAKGADVYGPPIPPGFQQVSWWQKIKTKFNETLTAWKSPQTDLTNQQARSEKSDNGVEWKYNGKNVQSIGDSHQANTQPALVKFRNVQVLPFPSIPKPQYKAKKEVPHYDALPELALINKTQRYQMGDVRKDALDFHAPSEQTMKINAKLMPLNNKALEEIEKPPHDSFKLVLGLLVWLFDNHDDALQAIHQISLKTQSNEVREKSLAFEGWILDSKNIKNLASFYLSKALDSSSHNKSSAKYDNWILSSLSAYAKDMLVTKSWLKHSTLESLNSSAELNNESKAFTTLVLAERAFDRKAYATARKIAQSVPAKTSWKEQARYLASICVFAEKDSKENLQTAGRELTELFKTVEDPGVFDATATTLGRIHFILGNYKAANQYLSQVSRETNIFIEAAVDNAWALLRSGNRNQAVGNMFTLHTPYFEGAYMPESYFLQSLGYQEICQFGDAMNSVKLYKNRYAQAYKTLIDFNAKNKNNPSAYYEDLVSYLSRKDSQMAGIILRELGRNPEFIKRQKALNNLSRDERQLTETFPKSAAQEDHYAETAMNEIRGQFKKEIAAFLKHKAGNMEEELKFLTANLSLLEYEIYAGASNNLALQGAQNFAIDEKKAEGPKPKYEDGKEFWPYEQEIWEDELNNFRSKIVDACAHVKTADNTN